MDMQKLMRQAQKMQNEMNRAQEKLKDMEVEGVAGGGVVKVTATGGQQIKAVEIDPEVVDPNDVEMLQDLILAAINDAMNKAGELANSEMGKITGGMKMPF
ncbi:MAG: YbaB/EbfC family nucleoid-associated protein [Bacillota bacterium]|jgi:DNA-binding YbaB/EbfC family protein